MDLQRPSPRDISSVLLALASACAFYCPPTMPPNTPVAPRWLVEHGLQLELCASLGRTCSLHWEGPGHPAAPCFKERGSSTRVDKPGGSWLHNPRVHLSPGECCERFAFTTVLSPPPACMGRSLALSLLGWWDWRQHLLMSMGSQERGKTWL